MSKEVINKLPEDHPLPILLKEIKNNEDLNDLPTQQGMAMGCLSAMLYYGQITPKELLDMQLFVLGTVELVLKGNEQIN